MVRAPEAGSVPTSSGGGTSGRSGPNAEQSRARYPDRTGYADVDGVRSFYEVYGEGEPTILFVPTWTIITSRIWKPQIPYFARRHRVVTFDPRGNGRSDRPASADAYAETEFGKDILAVMDDAGVDRAVLVSLSAGAERSLVAAAPRRTGSPDSSSPDRPFRLVSASRTGPSTSKRSFPTRAGRATTATRGDATTRVSSSSSSASASRSRTRPSRSRTPSAGASKRTVRRSSSRRIRPS